MKGKFGESDSEIVRTVVISFLSEKGKNMSRKTTKELIKELAQEIDVLEKLFTSLVEVLVEKEVLTQE